MESGPPKSEDKKAPVDSDDDDDDMDEMGDQIQELGAVQDGIGSINIGHKASATTSNNHQGQDIEKSGPIKANHKFHVPKST